MLKVISVCGNIHALGICLSVCVYLCVCWFSRPKVCVCVCACLCVCELCVFHTLTHDDTPSTFGCKKNTSMYGQKRHVLTTHACTHPDLKIIKLGCGSKVRLICEPFA